MLKFIWTVNNSAQLRYVSQTSPTANGHSGQSKTNLTKQSIAKLTALIKLRVIMETSKAYQSLAAKLFSIQNEFVKYSWKVNFLLEQVGVMRKLVLAIEIPESLSMMTKKKKRKSPFKRRREMVRLQAFRERKKNTLSNKNVTQSINTQSSNEKVLLL